MARALKTMGLEEIGLLRRRALRQLSLKRISPDDAGYIVATLDKLEAFIIHMNEKGADQE
jgi:hypothetical protein